MAISVTNPLSRALDRAILMTFRPFDFGKWLVLGFIAFLSELEAGGGGGGGPGGGGRLKLPMPGPGPRPPGSQPSTLPNELDQLLNWLQLHIVQVVVVGLILLLVGLALAALIMWLSSRGKFMLIHSIATNTAKVVEPWKRFRELGNSLFGFKFGMMFVGLFLVILIAAVGLFIAWGDIRANTFGGRAALGMVVFVVLWVPAVIALALVNWVTNTFVSTIMYARTCRVGQAWGEFVQNVMTGHVGVLIVFLLMQILLGIATAMIAFMVGCVTCCVGWIPYVSTVLLLPVILFLRSYSIYFLQQFGPEYVIIQEGPPPAPRGAFPVITPRDPGL